MNNVHLLQKTKNGQKRVWLVVECRKLGFFLSFRERMCTLSLGFRVFGPSDSLGPRNKVVLHIEDYTWAPVSGVFDKLREVGVLSYLFYPLFKCVYDA